MDFTKLKYRLKRSNRSATPSSRNVNVGLSSNVTAQPVAPTPSSPPATAASPPATSNLRDSSDLKPPTPRSDDPATSPPTSPAVYVAKPLENPATSPSTPPAAEVATPLDNPATSPPTPPAAELAKPVDATDSGDECETAEPVAAASSAPEASSPLLARGRRKRLLSTEARKRRNVRNRRRERRRRQASADGEISVQLRPALHENIRELLDDVTVIKVHIRENAACFTHPQRGEVLHLPATRLRPHESERHDDAGAQSADENGSGGSRGSEVVDEGDTVPPTNPVTATPAPAPCKRNMTNQHDADNRDDAAPEEPDDVVFVDMIPTVQERVREACRAAHNESVQKFYSYSATKEEDKEDAENLASGEVKSEPTAVQVGQAGMEQTATGSDSGEAPSPNTHPAAKPTTLNEDMGGATTTTPNGTSAGHKKQNTAKRRERVKASSMSAVLRIARSRGKLNNANNVAPPERHGEAPEPDVQEAGSSVEEQQLHEESAHKQGDSGDSVDGVQGQTDGGGGDQSGCASPIMPYHERPDGHSGHSGHARLTDSDDEDDSTPLATLMERTRKREMSSPEDSSRPRRKRKRSKVKRCMSFHESVNESNRNQSFIVEPTEPTTQEKQHEEQQPSSPESAPEATEQMGEAQADNGSNSNCESADQLWVDYATQKQQSFKLEFKEATALPETSGVNDALVDPTGDGSSSTAKGGRDAEENGSIEEVAQRSVDASMEDGLKDRMESTPGRETNKSINSVSNSSRKGCENWDNLTKAKEYGRVAGLDVLSQVRTNKNVNMDLHGTRAVDDMSSAQDKLRDITQACSPLSSSSPQVSAQNNPLSNIGAPTDKLRRVVCSGGALMVEIERSTRERDVQSVSKALASRENGQLDPKGSNPISTAIDVPKHRKTTHADQSAIGTSCDETRDRKREARKAPAADVVTEAVLGGADLSVFGKLPPLSVAFDGTEEVIDDQPGADTSETRENIRQPVASSVRVAKEHHVDIKSTRPQPKVFIPEPNKVRSQGDRRALHMARIGTNFEEGGTVDVKGISDKGGRSSDEGVTRFPPADNELVAQGGTVDGNMGPSDEDLENMSGEQFLSTMIEATNHFQEFLRDSG